MPENFQDRNMGRFEMDPMRKPSDASSFHAYNQQYGTTRQGAVSCGVNGSPYPQSSPNRQVYLAARSVGILCSIVLTVLASITLSVIPRGKWGAAVLSPCISTLFASSFEVWCILGANRRSHHWRRVLYDGALGIGYVIAFGFLVSFTSPDISRSDPKATASSAAVGIAILILMMIELLLQIAYTWSGIRELLRIRHVQTSGYEG
ncbi:hypothetical protein X797_011023 [Metarhizium robertsii]|uniref:Metallopeptidase, catalytic domain protein n=2 Tax=Metarhizium robertsii TaxID=568076 RepID=A0A0B2XF81_METRA|nr:Metallopeptidase, catalytic domain protein [Metarhizium robertsii ARSEF 23]EXU95901.1 hypothetical protein X797_011023 [Metarhizium robertsii]KHO10674.1 Metallopeptidase, catalytic domain protein [Metarhizium robertsii ARSEF 23]